MQLRGMPIEQHFVDNILVVATKFASFLIVSEIILSYASCCAAIQQPNNLSNHI